LYQWAKRGLKGWVIKPLEEESCFVLFNADGEHLHIGFAFLAFGFIATVISFELMKEIVI
jgi:hypothetical protein